MASQILKMLFFSLFVLLHIKEHLCKRPYPTIVASSDDAEKKLIN